MKSAFILILISLQLTSCVNKKKTSNRNNLEPAKFVENTSKEHGKYLVTVMDCNTCHTPNIMTEKGPQPDRSRLLSGYPADRPLPAYDKTTVSKGVLFPYPDLTAAVGPWGISFAGNLTPHETGLGTWNLEQFKLAMTAGKYKGLEGSRTLLPPMPWQSYATLSDTDIQAIFNYLMSIKPIANVAPSPIKPN